MSEKIRVLQFTIAESKGGRTQYVLNIWKHIDKTKIQFDFITFSPALSFEQELLEEGCKIYHISCHPEVDREQFIREFDAVLDNGYDVIHIHTSFWKDVIVEERAKAKGINKIIIHSHSTSCGNSLTREEEEEGIKLHNQVKSRLTEDMATDYWACSEEAAEWLYGGRIDKQKIKIIPNAIDTERFSYNPQQREEIRTDLGLKDKFVLGHVGRLEYVKNHAFMLELLKQVVKVDSNIILLLVGDGRLAESIREKARELEIENNVLMVGKSDVPEKYMQAMDVFLFPSLFEGFGLAVLEAQSAGLKCICSQEVPEKVMLTENVERLSLDSGHIWADRILDLRNGYERNSQSDVIRRNGYDIHEQIRQIEQAYME